MEAGSVTFEAAARAHTPRRPSNGSQFLRLCVEGANDRRERSRLNKARFTYSSLHNESKQNEINESSKTNCIRREERTATISAESSCKSPNRAEHCHSSEGRESIKQSYGSDYANLHPSHNLPQSLITAFDHDHTPHTAPLSKSRRTSYLTNQYQGITRIGRLQETTKINQFSNANIQCTSDAKNPLGSTDPAQHNLLCYPKQNYLTRPNSTPLPLSNRGKHKQKLEAKLNALTKSMNSPRRKVVLSESDSTKNIVKSYHRKSCRITNRYYLNDGVSIRNLHNHTEHEMYALQALGQIARLWRERKKRTEAIALNIINEGRGGSPSNTTLTSAIPENNCTGRNYRRLPHELTFESQNVLGILSRCLVRDVPALKFFSDTEQSFAQSAVTNSPSLSYTEKKCRPLNLNQVQDTRSGKETPRGVCYTLDENNNRQVITQPSRSRRHRASTSNNNSIYTPRREPTAPHLYSQATSNQFSIPGKNIANGSSKEKKSASKTSNSEYKPTVQPQITLEKATAKILHRKMVKRLRSTRNSLDRVTQQFLNTSRKASTHLESDLVLKKANGKVTL